MQNNTFGVVKHSHLFNKSFVLSFEIGYSGYMQEQL